MISLKNISKLYDTGKLKVAALQNISLDIKAGEFIAIMGPSGSGKSTLLNLLAFLDRPSSGTYLLNGKDMSSLDEDQLANFRNHIAGFIFQQFHLLHRMSARENTELPLIYAGKRYSGDCASERIKEVGLAHREKHYPSELSGGEQQRIAIARALVNDPDIIFADEPTGNLDSKNGNEILEILERLNKEGKTIVMVTHENDVARRAGRIIYMKDSEIVSQKLLKKKVSPKGKTVRKEPIDNCLKTSHVSFARAEFSDYIRQAVNSIVSHKLRSVLSMLGILIGVAAVIAMLAIGQGARESISKRLASLGSNLLIVRTGSHHRRGVTLESGLVPRFTIRDAAEIRKLDEVRSVSPKVRGEARVVHGNKNWSTNVEGVGIGYTSIRDAEPVMGRFFLQSELRSRKKVAIIGMTVVNELFGEKDPIGKTIKINRINFMVIGVFPQKGATSWRDMDDLVVMPITTAMYRVLGREYVDYIEVDVKSPELVDRAKSSVKALIIRLHRIKEGNEKSFYIRDMTEIRDALTGTAQTMAWLLGSVAAISLIVGGIGIMNIMLVSVKERTREIGLRKAIGASRRDILFQFLIEAALLSLVGGMAGLLLGSGISIAIASFAGWAVKVSLFSVLLSVVFSIFVGVCFGLWPAAQASQLNPIDALRYE